MTLRLSLLVLSCAALLSVSVTAAAQSVVRVDRAAEGFQLLRDGQPYQVRGVGGDGSLSRLAAAGGNSVRTWSGDDLATVLDEAQKNGLTVCAGLWLGHERHGFDYQNKSAVLRQLEQCLSVVRKHKDHPALLMWGVGNEMEGDGDNPAVWYAVNHIAREIKRIDPNHPTITMIAELGPQNSKLRSLERFCPDIDLVGVNSYGGIATLDERYREAGGTKPYLVTEHGPVGPWEVGKTEWGAPLEPTSTAKAGSYAAGYRRTVGQGGRCLGSYAFLWGHKQETTATWFGMLLPDGARLGAADAMTEMWTGAPPANRCPRIESLTVAGDAKLKPGEQLDAVVKAHDPDGDPVRLAWVLRHDSATIGVGGDFQPAQAALAGHLAVQGATATVTAPEGGGGYRLFVYVRDDHGGAAVGNVPLYVDAPIRPIPSPQAKLPLIVYGERADSPYIPSGYMGNTDAVAMTLDCEDDPHTGDTCLKVEYKAGDNWGGVLWQSPPNDWDGTQPGGLDLTGAAAVEFQARGAAGGEQVSFVLGVVDGDKPYRDTAKAELPNVRLTTQWQTLRIPLKGLDLSRIKTGFGWSAAGQGRPIAFYLDEIRYVSQ